MQRRTIFRSTASPFVRIEHLTRSELIPLVELAVDDAFVLVVKSGLQAGHAWLVDPFYNHAKNAISRFSGTDEAGHNPESLVGKTCDALAHFSLFDSELTFVFVDIEGMILNQQTA